MRAGRTTGGRASVLLTPLMTAGLLFAAVGCGGDDDFGGGNGQTAKESTSGDRLSDDASGSDTGEASGEGLCAVVLSVDLAAAFDGQLEFGEANDVVRGEICIIPILGAEGEGLIISLTTAGNFEQKAKFENQLPFKKLDSLGEEAFIVNQSDLNVLLADGTAISIGANAFWADGSPPDGAIVESGLVEIAEAVVASR